MSEQSSRDTQFAGFAKLLYEQFVNAAPTYIDGHVRRGTMSREEVEQIIAQRAYDFMKHMVKVIPHLIHNANITNLDAAMQYIPDMTE